MKMHFMKIHFICMKYYLLLNIHIFETTSNTYIHTYILSGITRHKLACRLFHSHRVKCAQASSASYGRRSWSNHIRFNNDMTKLLTFPTNLLCVPTRL